MKHILPVITTARNAIPSNEYKIAASKGKYIENVKGYKMTFKYVDRNYSSKGKCLILSLTPIPILNMVKTNIFFQQDS